MLLAYGCIRYNSVYVALFQGVLSGSKRAEVHIPYFAPSAKLQGVLRKAHSTRSQGLTTVLQMNYNINMFNLQILMN